MGMEIRRTDVGPGVSGFSDSCSRHLPTAEGALASLIGNLQRALILQLVHQILRGNSEGVPVPLPEDSKFAMFTSLHSHDL
jgi:hypothetical protein